MKFFIDGGPVIMLSILSASFIAVYIIVERLLYFKKISKNDEKIIERISSAIRNNHYDEAITICETVPTPVTNLMKAGIKNRNYTEQQIYDAIKDAANMEIPKLEKNLNMLGTIASIAPLLGLLGTVIGNMEAFGLIGSKGALGSMEVLAGGIAKALITTAFGLSIAIPITIFYNYLSNRVNNFILTLEIKANELVLLLNKK
ncbi:MAG: MotA/TolQ/ExbB proton channel family protein [Spirochaetes bacterium]|nr:MotA/TolQ/ExbB proton channel family protein [Spirochaetota bacterium]